MKQETLKKIVELTDGFYITCEPTEDDEGNIVYLDKYEVVVFDNQEYETDIFDFDTGKYQVDTWMLYPLILRRAVEGWNEKHESITYDVLGIICNDQAYEYDNYQKTEYLTPQEQAIEACLIELLEK